MGLSDLEEALLPAPRGAVSFLHGGHWGQQDTVLVPQNEQKFRKSEDDSCCKRLQKMLLLVSYPFFCSILSPDVYSRLHRILVHESHTLGVGLAGAALVLVPVRRVVNNLEDSQESSVDG